jgi:RNA polymerase sigma-70 factor (ECF subfamily)
MQYVRSREDADEIVNDTFLVLWEKQEELTLDQSIKPFLYTVVRNKSLNLLKKKKIEITEFDEGFEIASPHSSPIEILQARETEEAILELISRLPPKCRQVFVLSRKEHLGNKEIAGILDINEKTVENQISIAIKFIRAGLQSRHDHNGNNNGLKMIFFPWVLAWLMS